MHPDDEYTAKLARLDRRIAENDAHGTPDALWRAADAAYDKAELIERREGDDAALTTYGEVVRRLDGRREAGPRTMFLSALNKIAVIHSQHDRLDESRGAARMLVEGHLDDAPLDAARPVANSTLLLAYFLRLDSEFEQSIDLLQRLRGRYGEPGVRDRDRTLALSTRDLARALEQVGRQDEALRENDRLINVLGDPVDPEGRVMLAEAMSDKAYLLSEEAARLQDTALVAESDEQFRQLAQRFAGDPDPDIVRQVEWANSIIAPPAPARRGRLGRRRR